MNDEYFMGKAIEEAYISLKSGDWPIGCVIEMNGKILTQAHNQVYSTEDKMAHAEMIAMRTIQNILMQNKNAATLYTTYEPCPMCFGAAILNRIKRVVCGIDLDQSGAMFFRENLPILFKQEKFHVDFTRGILAEKCHEIFIKGKPTKKLIEDGLIRKSNSNDIKQLSL